MNVSRFQGDDNLNVQGAVSVIICAKNEEDNLKLMLPVILNQDFPEFEVIVVDDNSEDGTWGFLQEQAKKNIKLKVVQRKNDFIDFLGKKGALLKGVESSKYELLLLTDADCVPASNNWIRNMTSHFKQGTDIILGYSPYLKEEGLLNQLIRYETFYTALQYFSLALIGKPYMGVGRNLAYRKSIFYQSNAFDTHKALQSGDDDLLINDIATSSNVAIELRKDSWTRSKAKLSVDQWLFQKLRHFSTGRYYKLKFKILLGVLGLSTTVFTGLFFVMLTSYEYWIPAVLIFVSRGFLQFVVFKKSSNNLGEIDLLLNSFLFDMVLAVLAPIISLIAFYSNRNKWMI